MTDWIVVEGATKRCHQCAETIKAEARICHYCRARYAVETQGYCAREHGLRPADAEGRCAGCAGELVDRQVRSRFVGGGELAQAAPVAAVGRASGAGGADAGPPATPASAPSGETAPTAGPPPAAIPTARTSRHPPGRQRPPLDPGRVRLRKFAWALLVLVGIAFVAVVVPTVLPTGGRASVLPIDLPGLAPRPSPTPSPRPATATPEPTAAPTPLPLGAGAGSQDFAAGPACFATRGFGLSCLGEQGWVSLTSDNSQLRSDFIYALAACPDGTLLIAHEVGIQVFDSRAFVRSLPTWGVESATSVACGSDGLIAVGYNAGVSRLEAGAWRKLDISPLLPPDDPQASIDIQGIALDGEGGIWVAVDTSYGSTDGSIGRFDGSKWIVYRESQSLLPDIELQSLAIDQTGRVWAAHQDGLLMLEGGNWITHPLDLASEQTSLFVDRDDRLWFARQAEYGWIQDGVFQIYEIDPTRDFPGQTNAIWLDGRGRVWLATDYGATVFNGEGWITYHMHTSSLPSNQLSALAVIAGGPELPELVEEPKGSVAGRLLFNDEPLQQARVQLCSVPPPIFFRGPSPCSSQLYAPAVNTDAEGRFTLAVWPGQYFLTFTDQEGDWTRLTTGFAGMEIYRIWVDSGQDTVLDDIKLRD